MGEGKSGTIVLLPKGASKIRSGKRYHFRRRLSAAISNSPPSTCKHPVASRSAGRHEQPIPKTVFANLDLVAKQLGSIAEDHRTGHRSNRFESGFQRVCKSSGDATSGP